MKKKNVIVGEIYRAIVSGKVVRVRIDSVSEFGGWNATNLKTKHAVRIKTAARLAWPGVPKEYGPSYFAEKMSGLADAAKRVATEEKILKGPLATETVQ